MNLTKNRFFYLLLALAAYFIANPFLIESRKDSYVLGIFFTLILIGSLYVIGKEKWLLITAITLASLAFVAQWLLAGFFLAPSHVFIVYVVTIVFFMVMTVLVLRYVLRDQEVSFNSLCGAICGYLLIGLTWSFVYSAIFTLSPHSFSGSSLTTFNYQNPGQHFTYFSFVTLTTLGYGDLLPVSNPAKMFAWIEAVIGQIYLTVWLAQLVGLHIVGKTRKRKNA